MDFGRLFTTGIMIGFLAAVFILACGFALKRFW